MKYLEALAAIPTARLTLWFILATYGLILLENAPWTQDVIEFLINMHGAS